MQEATLEAVRVALQSQSEVTLNQLVNNVSQTVLNNPAVCVLLIMEYVGHELIVKKRSETDISSTSSSHSKQNLQVQDPANSSNSSPTPKNNGSDHEIRAEFFNKIQGCFESGPKMEPHTEFNKILDPPPRLQQKDSKLTHNKFVNWVTRCLKSAEKMPLLEHEVENVYDETIRKSSSVNIPYKQQLAEFGHESLLNFLSSFLPNKKPVSSEIIQFSSCGIRVEESDNTLDGKTGIFYCIDTGDTHPWLKEEYDDLVDLETIESEKNGILQAYTNAESDLNDTNNLMQRWETRRILQLYKASNLEELYNMEFVGPTLSEHESIEHNSYDIINDIENELEHQLQDDAHSSYDENEVPAELDSREVAKVCQKYVRESESISTEGSLPVFELNPELLSPPITLEPVNSANLPDMTLIDQINEIDQQNVDLETVQQKQVIYDYQDDSDDLETPNDRRNLSTMSLEHQNIETNQKITINNESEDRIDQNQRPIIGDFEDDDSSYDSDENRNESQENNGPENNQYDEKQIVEKSEELENFKVGDMFVPQVSFLKSLSFKESKIPFEPISGSVVVDPQAGEISMKVILDPLELREEISRPMKALYQIQDIIEATVLSKISISTPLINNHPIIYLPLYERAIIKEFNPPKCKIYLIDRDRHIPDAKIDELCLLESRFCNKEAQAFEIVIDRLNFPLGIEPLTVMTIIQSFISQTENSTFVGKFFYNEGRLWGDQLEKIPNNENGEEPDTIQHFLHVFATFQILAQSKADLFKLANELPKNPSPDKKLQSFGEPPQRSLIPNRRSSSENTMANRIRAESEIKSNQSELTENISKEVDERVPEPEVVTSEITVECPNQENIDEPADLPKFSNTPLQSVQNLGDGHSISSTKSRHGKRALHERLRQMRKAKSEKQNPNK